METKFTTIFSPLIIFIFFTFFCNNLHHHTVQAQSNTTGYTCPSNQTTYPCQTYVLFRAMAPSYLSLANISDLFGLSRLMISKPNNISSPDGPLTQNQELLIPIQCSCNRINSSASISYAALNYTTKPDDSFYYVSTDHFQNLTTFQSVEVVNPNLIPTNLPIGGNVVYPVFCKCPDSTLLGNRVNYMISYVFQPSDTLNSISSRFNSSVTSLVVVNGENIQPFDTVFIPVSRLPQLTQPIATPAPTPTPTPTTTTGDSNSEGNDRKGEVIGLSIGVAICGLLLILVSVSWVYREMKLKNVDDEEKLRRFDGGGGGKKGVSKKNEDVNLMADVSDCLDKYKVYAIDELMKATDGFDEKCLIEGCVYKGEIDGEVYAVKKMNWNAYQELRILQKVNHGNLVKLEGFCIDHEEANCYLVYEYIENGSLHSWLHRHNKEKLNWKTRLGIAIDVANGLQYIHEHTRPRVVHKDIKTTNILLDSTMRAKIANFGLAKSGCNAITMHIVGTQGYIAPEYLADGVVSTKMDVFAFGVVLLELVSGREAVDERGNTLCHDGVKKFQGEDDEKITKLKEFMDGSLMNESCSIESVLNVVGVAIACLHRDPSRRPSMVDIVYALCKSDEFSFDISESGLSPGKVLAR